MGAKRRVPDEGIRLSVRSRTMVERGMSVATVTRSRIKLLFIIIIIEEQDTGE